MEITVIKKWKNRKWYVGKIGKHILVSNGWVNDYPFYNEKTGDNFARMELQKTGKIDKGFLSFDFPEALPKYLTSWLLNAYYTKNPILNV